MDEQAFHLLHEMTQVSYLQRTGRSLNSSPAEMVVFLEATLLMGGLGYPRGSMYWSKGTHAAAVADKITRDSLFLLRSNLKVINDLAVSGADKESDRLWKVRALVDVTETLASLCCIHAMMSKSAPSSVDAQSSSLFAGSQIQQA